MQQLQAELISREWSPIIWFTDWNLAGGYLEVVCWTLLAIIITAQSSDSERPALCGCREHGAVYTLSSGNALWTILGELASYCHNPKSFHGRNRWGGHSEVDGKMQSPYSAFLQTIARNVGGLKHATLPERRRHNEMCSAFLWGPAPVQSLGLLKGCTANINHSQCSLTKLGIPCLKARLNEYALLWKKAALQLSSLINECGKGSFF